MQWAAAAVPASLIMRRKGCLMESIMTFLLLIAILEIIKYIKKIVAHSVKMCDYKNNFCRIRFEGTVKATLCILIITH